MRATDRTKSSGVLAIGTGIVLSVAAGGCGSPGPTAASFTIREVPRQNRDALLDAAEIALIDRGYQINKRDAAAGIVTTFPVEGVPEKGAEPAGGLRGRVQAPTRHMAQVRIEETAGLMRVHCRLVVQEQITEAQRFFVREQGDQDSYRQTAIDRDAATTEEQNTAWQMIRRDKTAEREILEAMLGEKADAP